MDRSILNEIIENGISPRNFMIMELIDNPDFLILDSQRYQESDLRGFLKEYGDNIIFLSISLLREDIEGWKDFKGIPEYLGNLEYNENQILSILNQ